MENKFSIPEIVHKLKNHELSGKTLSREVCLEIVGLLKSEGQKTISIAALLGYTPRQVRRFLREVRKENSAKFTKEFCREHIGSTIQKIELATDFLVRTYNDPSHPIQSRLKGGESTLQYAIKALSALRKIGLSMHGSEKDDEKTLSPSKNDSTNKPLETELQREEKKIGLMLHPMDRERVMEMHRHMFQHPDESKERLEKAKEITRFLEERQKPSNPEELPPVSS